MSRLDEYLEMIGPLQGPQRGSQKISKDNIIDQISDMDNLAHSIGGTLREFVDEIFGDTHDADPDQDYPSTWSEYFSSRFGGDRNYTLESMKKILKKQNKKEYDKLSSKYGW